MSQKLKDIIFEHNLVDIYPYKSAPTWDNGRHGLNCIAKSVDHFLLHEQMVEKIGNFQSCIVNKYISDHRPITLTWRRKDTRFFFPFKYNKVWLEDPEFEDLVCAHYSKDRDRTIGISPMEDIIYRLRALKEMVKRWE